MSKKISITYNEEIHSNDTLQIFTKKNQVILPYTKKQVKEALKTNRYDTSADVTKNLYTIPLSNYRHRYLSRFREAYRLARRDGYSALDGLRLGLEVLPKKYLFPAIITACTNMDDLDVYLDCLDSNELDDFQIFKVEYK